MSKITIAIIVCLTAALFFGLGYQTGYEPEPPKQYRPLPQRESEAELTGVALEVKRILQLADPLERAAQLASLLQGLGAESIPAVRDGFDSVFLDVRETELRLLARWWARLDPQGAFRWTQVEWNASSVLGEVMRSWAARDPKAARDALLALKTNPVRYRECVQEVALGWDESGQDGLGEFMAAMPPGAERQRVIGQITRRMILRDGVEATTDWVEGLPDDDPPNRFKLQSYRRVASAIATQEPLLGAAWAEERGEGKYGDGLYRRVGTRWAEKDGLAAMTWLGTLPAGSRRDVGVRETYRRWVSRDRVPALEWMANQPHARWLEKGKSLYVMIVSRKEPERAIELAGDFEDESIKFETLEQIARGWMARDPEAARAWIEASDLPEMAKTRAMRPRQPRRARPPVTDVE